MSRKNTSSAASRNVSPRLKMYTCMIMMTRYSMVQWKADRVASITMKKAPSEKTESIIVLVTFDKVKIYFGI